MHSLGRGAWLLAIVSIVLVVTAATFVAWLSSSGGAGTPEKSLEDLCLTLDEMEGFSLVRERIHLNGLDVESGVEPGDAAALAKLYAEAGREGAVEREFAPVGYDGAVVCRVERFADAAGAGLLFNETGFVRTPLLGRPDTGTFASASGPTIGDESKRYVSIHAVLSAATVIFRVDNMLARIDVRDSSSGEWLAGPALADSASMLAGRLERKLAVTR